MSIKTTTFPTIKVRVFMIAWRLLWFVCMPLVLLYLWKRARKEPLYWGYLPERFGLHPQRPEQCVWIHAVSLGEVRSAMFLINTLLQQGEKVVVTVFTPAGRDELRRLYPDAITQGRLVPCWVPFDYDLAFRRFFKAFRPKYGLVMEVEFWPGMIMSARKHKVPLFLCNGQYPAKSWERDQSRFISAADIVPGFAGVMVKSDRMAVPFRALGLNNIAVTGELRFDQPINEADAAKGAGLRAQYLADRQVVVFASAVADEDALFVSVMQSAMKSQKTNPFFVYVPRKPEHFDTVYTRLVAAGLRVTRRSELTPETLSRYDVLLGDSLGEMHFYLGFADRIVVGGGFAPQGSHNIIEPLLHRKPVIIGPSFWTIDFPAVEAVDAGVCKIAQPTTLGDMLFGPNIWSDPSEFIAAMKGGAQKSLAALDQFMK